MKESIVGVVADKNLARGGFCALQIFCFGYNPQGIFFPLNSIAVAFKTLE